MPDVSERQQCPQDRFSRRPGHPGSRAAPRSLPVPLGSGRRRPVHSALRGQPRSVLPLASRHCVVGRLHHGGRRPDTLCHHLDPMTPMRSAIADSSPGDGLANQLSLCTDSGGKPERPRRPSDPRVVGRTSCAVTGDIRGSCVSDSSRLSIQPLRWLVRAPLL